MYGVNSKPTQDPTKLCTLYTKRWFLFWSIQCIECAQVCTIVGAALQSTLYSHPITKHSLRFDRTELTGNLLKGSGSLNTHLSRMQVSSTSSLGNISKFQWCMFWCTTLRTPIQRTPISITALAHTSVCQSGAPSILYYAQNVIVYVYPHMLYMTRLKFRSLHISMNAHC